MATVYLLAGQPLVNPDQGSLVPIISETMFDTIPQGTHIFAYFPQMPNFPAGYYRMTKV